MRKKIRFAIFGILFLTFVFSSALVVYADDTSVTPVPTVSVAPTVATTPTVTPEPTATPTPRPTATPTPVPPPYYVGDYDEDGVWVGYTEYEAATLNYLADFNDLLEDILWYQKNVVALLLILVCFEIHRLVRSWVKGVGLK